LRVEGSVSRVRTREDDEAGRECEVPGRRGLSEYFFWLELRDFEDDVLNGSSRRGSSCEYGRKGGERDPEGGFIGSVAASDTLG
jgi:hypothetical protein